MEEMWGTVIDGMLGVSLAFCGGVVHLGQRVASSWWGTTYRRPPNAPPPSELSKKIAPQLCEAKSIGGEGGIRTLGDVATTPDFESGTFDHSATSPTLTFAAGHCRKFYQ